MIKHIIKDMVCNEIRIRSIIFVKYDRAQKMNYKFSNIL